MEQILRTLTLEFFGEGKHKITPEAFLKLENGLFLDVRSTEEAEAISIGLKTYSTIEFHNIPVNELPDRLDELESSKGKSIGVFCPANVRASIAFAYLLKEGFKDVRIVEGGYSALTDAIKPGKVLKAVS